MQIKEVYKCLYMSVMSSCFYPVLYFFYMVRQQLIDVSQELIYDFNIIVKENSYILKPTICFEILILAGEHGLLKAD